jgi:hypothetical protein
MKKSKSNSYLLELAVLILLVNVAITFDLGQVGQASIFSCGK